MGEYQDASDITHGFLYNAGIYTTLDDPSGIKSQQSTQAFGINDLDQIVRTIRLLLATNMASFLAQATIPPRSGPQGSGATAFGINNAGEVVGVRAAVVQSATPIPSALPLFATGLGALGLLGWRRKFAAVLGCSDARVPVELIFSEGPNHLFVIRVAGNGLGTEVLGSLKYAVDHLAKSLKLVVVLGHSGCGAVTTAVDVFLNPGNNLSIVTEHSLRNILDGLLVVVQVPRMHCGESSGRMLKVTRDIDGL